MKEYTYNRSYDLRFYREPKSYLENIDTDRLRKDLDYVINGNKQDKIRIRDIVVRITEPKIVLAVDILDLTIYKKSEEAYVSGNASVEVAATFLQDIIDFLHPEISSICEMKLYYKEWL